ncbi:MAG: biopolymer transporter ExbD [Pseudomonadota bacterium]
MRRLSKPRKRMDEEERILPLINIVFLLLIFFMVMGRLSAGDPFEILPPKSLSEGQPPAEEFLISIGPEGQLALNGEVMAADAVLAQIEDSDQDQVRIKSDGRAEARAVVALIERLRLAGIESIKLMTVPGTSSALASTGAEE